MQLPTAVVMVRPASFGFNPDTAPSFMFQRETTEASRKEIERRARMEFDILAGRLRAAGVDVIIIEDKEDLNTPDAVFPNNWVSFHHDGTVVLYPMLAPSRRPERRRDIIEKLEASGFRTSRVIDLTHHEDQGRFLEGTGSVVFDHADHLAYANISPRTNEQVLNELCAEPRLQTRHLPRCSEKWRCNPAHRHDSERRRPLCHLLRRFDRRCGRPKTRSG